MNINGFNSGVNQARHLIKSKRTVLDLEGRLAGSGMSFERFSELLNSDTPLSDKLAEIQKAFGDIVNEEALGITIQAVQDGRMSMEEVFRRSTVRSRGLTVTKEETLAALKAARKANRAHLMTPNNDREIGRRFGAILSRLQSGRTITSAERRFLRRHYPDIYAKAARAEQKARQVERAMRNSNSPQEARRILTNAQMAAISGNVNNSNLFVVSRLGNINPNNLNQGRNITVNMSVNKINVTI